MSDRPIQVGDLVMMVRPRSCCPEHSGYGATGIVKEIHTRRSYCPHCKRDHPDGTVFAIATFTKNNGCEISRLKRIDPPALEDETERGEELTV